MDREVSKGLDFAVPYSEGDATVLAGVESWEQKDSVEQARLRSQRARAGVKCDGCGRVGFFRRNCPSCGPQYELDRRARFAPTILPRFKEFPRAFGTWATKLLRLAAHPKTHELTRTVGMVRPPHSKAIQFAALTSFTISAAATA